MATSFPYILARLPAVPRSSLEALGYRRTLALLEALSAPGSEERRVNAAFAADSGEHDPAAVRLLQSEPFLSALLEENGELGRRVAQLRPVAAGAMKKKERQTVRAALRYLWRAALRPVPCGRLCGTAVARADVRESPGVANLSRRDVVHSVGASRVAAADRALWADPAIGRKSRLYVSPLCWSAQGAVWYWNRNAAVAEVLGPSMAALVAEIDRCPGIRWLDLDESYETDLPAALATGLIEQHAAVPGEDDREAALTLLWEAMPHNLPLLTHIAALTPEDDGAPAVKDSGLHCDSYCAHELQIDRTGMDEFFREMEEFGGLLAEDARPESQIAAELFQMLHPRGGPIPLMQFYQECLETARVHGMQFDRPDWAQLGQALGIDTLDSTARQASLLESSFHGADSVTFHPPEQWRKKRTDADRMCFRFRRTADGPEGARYHLSYFGAGRMSLLPRYQSLPFETIGDLQAAAREWFARWPDVCEIFGGFPHDADRHLPVTERTIQFANSVPQPGSIRFGDLRVAWSPTYRTLILTGESGARIRPVHLGVTAEFALPAPVRFALTLGHPEVSALEAICRVLQQVLANAILNSRANVQVLPEITLASRIVLSPKLWILRRAVFPQIAAPVDARGFVEFHDWLRQLQLPQRLLQVCRPGGEPQWLDAGHPEGVNNFLRILQTAEVAIVGASWLARDQDGIPSASGWYEAEYYTELTSRGAVESVWAQAAVERTHA